MRESLASTAQYTLERLRRRRRLAAGCAPGSRPPPGVPDININDLVTFCAIRALLEMPDLNAEFIDGKIYSHAEIHIGFACDTRAGCWSPWSAMRTSSLPANWRRG